MSLVAVGDAVDAGHFGMEFVRSKDPKMPNAEFPKTCRKCKVAWPCPAIAAARAAK